MSNTIPPTCAGRPRRLRDAARRLDRGRVTAGGKHFPVGAGMIETAENLRREYQIPAEQDEYALRSHQRAAAAWDEG